MRAQSRRAGTAALLAASLSVAVAAFPAYAGSTVHTQRVSHAIVRRSQPRVAGVSARPVSRPRPARTIGIANPRRNCAANNDPAAWTVGLVNRCRAREGVGPLRLPNNWASLSARHKLLVIIDLERVNRGLRPIVGLSAAIDRLAQRAANAGGDPAFPPGGFSWGGGMWAGEGSVIESDFAWMYDDGYGSGNVDCTNPHAKGCWGHREIILVRGRGTLVGGTGEKHERGDNSYAVEVLSGYAPRHLTFTWASELKHFRTKPGIEPLR